MKENKNQDDDDENGKTFFLFCMVRLLQVAIGVMFLQRERREQRTGEKSVQSQKPFSSWKRRKAK